MRNFVVLLGLLLVLLSSANCDSRTDSDSQENNGIPFSRFAKSPKSLARILRGGQQSFSRILKGGPNTFSRILRAYMEAPENAGEKRESFSRILRSGFSRIHKKSAEEPEAHFQDLSDDDFADAFDEMERPARAQSFSRILRGSEEFSRIL